MQVARAADLELGQPALQAALASAPPPPERDALQAAARAGAVLHERQRAESWSYVEADGTRWARR